MSAPKIPPKIRPVADIDEDPNAALRPYVSPPCYAHEVDPAYFGLPPRPDLPGLRRAARHLAEAEAALGGALRAISSG